MRRNGILRIALTLMFCAVTGAEVAGQRVMAVADASGRAIEAKAFRTVKSFYCPEASQGVAVDADYFYGIGNQVIVKCEKASGRKVAEWREENPDLIRHFDGGIVLDGLLYCSHSNFPEVPMASSIEVFDTATLKHVRTISLGIESGSCTWVVRGDGCWYLGFAHYGNGSNGAEPLRDNSWTQFVQYDRDWHRVQGWILPKALLEQLSPNSVSGCLFLDGRFYCTGHDAMALFVLDFPPYGMRLVHSGSIDIPFHGQGIALDADGNLWGIDRRSASVLCAAPVAE